MASSKAQNHATLYAFSIFLLFSSISIDFVHGARSRLPKITTIEGACAGGNQGLYTPDTCIATLRSNPKIVSSKSAFDLAINIIEAGIASGTDTLARIESLLKGAKNDDGLKQCQRGYSGAVGSFKSALAEVQDDKDFNTSTYDPLIGSTDDIGLCKNVTDKTILKGNEVVPIYGLSAFQVIDGL